MCNLVNVKSMIQSINNSDYSMSDTLEHFILFMENNDWFGIEPQIINQNGIDEMYFSCKEADFINSKLQTYLYHKTLTEEEIYLIYLEQMKEKYPKTYNSFLKFIEKRESKQSIAINKINDIMDFQMFHMSDELHSYDDYMIEKLIVHMCDELQLNTGNYLLDYLFWLKKHYKVRYSNSIDYVLSSRNNESRTKQAYESDRYLELIYYLFNTGYIVENKLYENACDNINTANTWSYLSIHMICSLRDTDITRIPHPRLRKEPKEILQLIKEGKFEDFDALLVANSVLRQLNNLPLDPNKVEKYSGIPFIKLTIPMSSMVHFGTLFAILESHRILKGQQNKPFIRPVKDYELISRHLGDDIGDLFFYEDFSTRSANKTNMQAIEMFADDILDNSENSMVHAKGYMLAALARSHKGSYGEFAHSAEIYLKDANFSGYSPEFIVRELFERGVCSFIVSMLLKMITGGEYNKLSVINQTKLIKEVGLSPNEIETYLACIDNSIENAKEIVSELYTKAENERKDFILKILHNIGCGYAVSKENDCLCYIMAIQGICPYDVKKQCIGCKYEISTTSTVYLLASEFNRIIKLRDNSDTDHVREKYTKILKEVLLPSLNEIFICIKDLYGDETLQTIEQVIKEIQNE